MNGRSDGPRGGTVSRAMRDPARPAARSRSRRPLAAQSLAQAPRPPARRARRSTAPSGASPSWTRRASSSTAATRAGSSPPRATPSSSSRAVAAALLPPDFRVRTSVYASAPVVNGVLTGDLVLYGRGDPDARAALLRDRHAGRRRLRPRPVRPAPRAGRHAAPARRCARCGAIWSATGAGSSRR